MNRRLKILLRYAAYYFRAKTKYQVHSPFVFTFVERVLEDQRYFYAFDHIETVRRKMAQSAETIPVEDFGAGAIGGNGPMRRIASIAAAAVSPVEECRQLFRIVQLYKPSTILEFGTSLGVSALYLSEGAPEAKTVTLEGAPAIAAVARQNIELYYARFRKVAHWPKIDVVEGRFEDTLEKALQGLGRLDCVFIDGNHRKEPTLRYFHECLQFAHSGSVFILDDIHWSEEMESAWKEIQGHPRVRLTIDLFWLGVVFFDPAMLEKIHVSLIKFRYKPFSLGLF